MRTFINSVVAKVFIFSFSVFIIGCEKTENEGGSVNVKSRTFANTIWSYSSPHHYLDLSVPELTVDNINSAAVLVYFSVVDGIWRSVPYTEYASPSNYFMNFSASQGSVKITWTYNSTFSSGDDPNKYYDTNVKFKVVVIPSSAQALKPNVNFTNYEEVRKNFNL